MPVAIQTTRDGVPSGKERVLSPGSKFRFTHEVSPVTSILNHVGKGRGRVGADGNSVSVTSLDEIGRTRTTIYTGEKINRRFVTETPEIRVLGVVLRRGSKKTVIFIRK